MKANRQRRRRLGGRSPDQEQEWGAWAPGPGCKQQEHTEGWSQSFQPWERGGAAGAEGQGQRGAQALETSRCPTKRPHSLPGWTPSGR